MKNKNKKGRKKEGEREEKEKEKEFHPGWPHHIGHHHTTTQIANGIAFLTLHFPPGPA